MLCRASASFLSLSLFLLLLLLPSVFFHRLFAHLMKSTHIFCNHLCSIYPISDEIADTGTLFSDTKSHYSHNNNNIIIFCIWCCVLYYITLNHVPERHCFLFSLNYVNNLKWQTSLIYESISCSPTLYPRNVINRLKKAPFSFCKSKQNLYLCHHFCSKWRFCRLSNRFQCIQTQF